MKIDAENPLLLNMQYVKGNKKQKIPDYLYVLWKDLDTGEKHLEKVPEPKMDIYFEKPEYRDHPNFIRNWQYLDRVNKYTCKYSDIKYAILNDWGQEGRELWNNAMATRDYKQLKKIDLYPYVFGHDFNVTTYYRNAWMNTIKKPEKIDLHTAFLDIEVDSFDHVGFAKAETDPIDLVTVIDAKNMKSYTFALVGREYEMRDTSHLNEEAAKHIQSTDRVRKKWHDYRIKKEQELMNNIDGLKEELSQMFDEIYGEIDYNFYFYKDERQMLIHLFQLIQKISPDFMFIWNIKFDVPYIMDRMKALGLDPKDYMCHPDYPVKECYFKFDRHNFEIKNKSDFFHVTDKTLWYCQMILYAAKRKGGDELPSKKLTDIAQEEIGDEKLDYSEVDEFKKFSYMNYWKYFIYNIKDVLLQLGIDRVTEDSRTLYVTSYENLTEYADVWKQTVVLRNVQYHSHLKNGFIPGANENGILASFLPPETEEEKKQKKKEKGFEGAVVGEPRLINPFGEKMFGKKTNYLFSKSIDMDMSAFYPNTNDLHNIDPQALIFKCIAPATQWSVLGGDIPFKGITDVQLIEDNRDSWREKSAKLDEYDRRTWIEDVSKEILDNFVSRNYLSLGYKFFNLPSFEELEEELMGVM